MLADIRRAFDDLACACCLEGAATPLRLAASPVYVRVGVAAVAAFAASAALRLCGTLPPPETDRGCFFVPLDPA